MTDTCANSIQTVPTASAENILFPSRGAMTSNNGSGTQPQNIQTLEFDLALLSRMFWTNFQRDTLLSFRWFKRYCFLSFHSEDSLKQKSSSLTVDPIAILTVTFSRTPPSPCDPQQGVFCQSAAFHLAQ